MPTLLKTIILAHSLTLANTPEQCLVLLSGMGVPCGLISQGENGTAKIRVRDREIRYPTDASPDARSSVFNAVLREADTLNGAFLYGLAALAKEWILAQDAGKILIPLRRGDVPEVPNVVESGYPAGYTAVQGIVCKVL